MLDPRDQQRRLRRVVMLSGMTGFVMVSLLMMILTPTSPDPVKSHQRWLFIAQVAVACALMTMSLTYFLLRRQR
jgi:hypothetical protein